MQMLLSDTFNAVSHDAYPLHAALIDPRDEKTHGGGTLGQTCDTSSTGCVFKL